MSILNPRRPYTNILSSLIPKNTHPGHRTFKRVQLALPALVPSLQPLRRQRLKDSLIYSRNTRSVTLSCHVSITGAVHRFSRTLLIVKSPGNRTPQPIPAALSGPLENVAGPSARLPYLRNDCLIRSHHRCVATRTSDAEEAGKRFKRREFKDNDGKTLV